MEWLVRNATCDIENEGNTSTAEIYRFIVEASLTAGPSSRCMIEHPFIPTILTIEEGLEENPNLLRDTKNSPWSKVRILSRDNNLKMRFIHNSDTNILYYDGPWIYSPLCSKGEVAAKNTKGFNASS